MKWPNLATRNKVFGYRFRLSKLADNPNSAAMVKF